MKVILYALCYNEEYMLPYFIRHYKNFVSHFVFYDNFSTDNSREIMKTAPNVMIKDYGSNDEIRDDVMISLKNNCWKSARRHADWVIVVDIDELIYHPNMINLLKSGKQVGATILKPAGFQMVGDTIPSGEGQIYEEMNTGALDSKYSKLAIFNPRAIAEMNYIHGCHAASPRGRVAIKKPIGLKLLHYHYLTLKHYTARCKERAKRLSKLNKEKNWGTEYLNSPENLRKDYMRVFNRARKIV